MAQRHKCVTVNVAVAGSIPTRVNEKFNIFLFPYSGNKAKRDIEFPGSLCLPCYVWNTACCFFSIKYISLFLTIFKGHTKSRMGRKTK